MQTRNLIAAPALALLLGLSACSGSTNDGPTAAPPATQTDAAASPTTATGEHAAAFVGDWTLESAIIDGTTVRGTDVLQRMGSTIDQITIDADGTFTLTVVQTGSASTTLEGTWESTGSMTATLEAEGRSHEATITGGRMTYDVTQADGTTNSLFFVKS